MGQSGLVDEVEQCCEVRMWQETELGCQGVYVFGRGHDSDVK